MLIVLVSLAIVGLVAFALWSAQRGGGASVDGAGNAFSAYYGKNRSTPGRSPPCAKCEHKGCVGAGECRCPCHRSATAKK